MGTPCLIIVFNRLRLPVALADFVASRGCDPIFIDNNSSYRPLMEYYHSHCPYKVMHLNKNYGHTAIWNPETTVLERLQIAGEYIVTDPDLDLSGIPDDFLEILKGGLNKYKKAQKCGFSLDFNDLPEGEVKEWEKSLWQYPLDEMYFKAPIDTTFALYRADVRHYTINDCIRTNKPYMAKHVPWKYRPENIKYLPKDEQFYLKTSNGSCTLKSNILKK